MPLPGDILGGKYRIEAIIGRGGMSLVYAATHQELDQLVAIKVLSGQALRIPSFVARLKREARASSRIRSEHVVRIFDVGELGASRIPYLVMEHLGGVDLAAHLAHCERLPVDLAIMCVVHACEGLAEAHALGIVHRDLKPANLFLTERPDGSPCVKVLDFGISRMPPRSALSPLTDPGVVLGTPSYMAPEQMEAARGVDARSDIWALGAILYELLVGRPPYVGDSLPNIFSQILRSPPPRPSDVRRDVPPAVDGVVARCLAVEPGARYQSVAELARALSRCASGTSGTERDAAARITRVLRRHHHGGGPAPVESSRSLHAVVGTKGTTEARRVRTGRRFATAIGATVAGAVIGFVLLSLSEAKAPTSPMPPAAPTEPADDHGTALSFAPIVVRPLAGGAAAGAAPMSPLQGVSRGLERTDVSPDASPKATGHAPVELEIESVMSPADADVAP